MPTNAEIWQEIVELKKRMDNYEKKTNDIQAIVLRVEVIVTKVFRFLKWFGTVATGVLIAYLGSLLFHYVRP